MSKLDQIRARFGSLPKEYVETLRPSVKKLLTEDLPLLIVFANAAVNGNKRQFEDMANEFLDTEVKH